jgi:hypothetical protein
MSGCFFVFVLFFVLYKCKKCLKIPQGLSEAENRRRTDIKMIKRKRTNNDLLNTTQIEQLELHYKSGMNSCAPE